LDLSYLIQSLIPCHCTRSNCYCWLNFNAICQFFHIFAGSYPLFSRSLRTGSCFGWNPQWIGQQILLKFNPATVNGSNQFYLRVFASNKEEVPISEQKIFVLSHSAPNVMLRFVHVIKCSKSAIQPDNCNSKLYFEDVMLHVLYVFL